METNCDNYTILLILEIIKLCFVREKHKRSYWQVKGQIRGIYNKKDSRTGFILELFKLLLFIG